MSDNDYVKVRHAGEAEMLSKCLELAGFKYGYSGVERTRRAFSNMTYITIDHDNQLYCGSKGGAVDIVWRKLMRPEIELMKKTLKKVEGLSIDEIYLVGRFNDMFGEDGLKKVTDGFGRKYSCIGNIPYKKREIVFRRMRNAINNQHNLDNHRKVMSSDGSRLERVWVTKDGREIPISKMKDDHLNNTILFIDRKISEGFLDLPSNKKLSDILKEMEEERLRRKMPLPLVPIKTLTYRKGNV
jgi:hypothetical protein